MTSRIPSLVLRESELPAGIEELVRESEAEGFAFVRRLRDDWASGQNRFDGPGEGFFVSRVGTTLAGVCGLNLDPFAADPACARLRRLYVRPAMRRRGVASDLTAAALALARERFSVVRLRTDRADASAFYLALGFQRVTADPDATHQLPLGNSDI